MRRTGLRWLLTLLCVATPGAIQAQAVARTVSGFVRDSMGRPLDNAVIALNPIGKVIATRATTGGRFRLDRINPGRYTMRTTWIGYLPDERTIVVPAEGLEVTVTLVPVPFRLDTMKVVARRNGIYGTTVQRADFRALGGVDVSVVGTRHRTRTAADGAFSFGEVAEGGWVVLGKRDGFETRMIPVAVPDSAAVELALALDTVRTRAQQNANTQVFDMQMRVSRRQTTASALVPGQEFAAHRSQTLDIALRYSPSFLVKGLIIENVECVYVDGKRMSGVLAKDIPAEGVALVEVYNHRGGPSLEMFGSALTCGGGPIRQSFGPSGRELRTYYPPNPTTVAYIYVWNK